MTSLRILLSLAIVHLGLLATACAPGGQPPEQREDSVEQAEPSTHGEGVISDQDFESSDTGSWEAPSPESAESEDASQASEEEKKPTP